MLPYLDNHILSNILNRLNFQDLHNTRSVNQQFRDVAKETYPNVQTFFKTLSNRAYASSEITNNEMKYDANILFPYNQNLNYSEKEYWAQVGVSLIATGKNKGLLNAIKYKLLQCNHEKNKFEEHLTTEQQRIVNHAPIKNHNVVIQAFAGTGKTTTLYEYAKRWRNKRILYITYNKSLAEDSKIKFADCEHVDAMTIHSLAFSFFNKSKLFTEVGNLTIDDVYACLNEDVLCPKIHLEDCKRILDNFNKYINSDHKGSDDPNVNFLWNEMFHGKKLKVSHDAYLKYYQLSKVKLNYDVILLDEVQDCTDCVLHIVLSQPCTRVFVGDRYQQIYSFKHVNNPFAYIYNTKYPHETFHLSVSFRMGFDLMYYTNMFLEKKFGELHGFSKCKQSNTDIHSDVCHGSPNFSFRKLPRKTVILCRYNVSMLKCIFDLTACGYSFTCYGKSINCAKEAEIVTDFIRFRNDELVSIKHRKLKEFTTFDEMMSHFYTANNNKWKDRINLFLQHGEELLNMWERTSDCLNDNDCDFMVTTAHQSKGSEFDNVCLYNDFQINNQDAVNICYVAITRAKKALYLNKLLVSFFEKYKNKVYYNTTIHSKSSKRCHICKTCFTNTMVLTENDPNAVFGKDCEIYTYEHTCRNCSKTLF